MKEGRGSSAGWVGVVARQRSSALCCFDRWWWWVGGSLAVVNGLDVFWWEEAHVSVATSPPAQWVWAVKQLDDVASEEAQLGGVVRREVEEGVAVVRTLQRVRDRKERGVSGEQAPQILTFNWENLNQLDSLMTGKCKFTVHCRSAPLEAPFINSCSAAFLVPWLVVCWGYFEMKPPDDLTGRPDPLGFLWVLSCCLLVFFNKQLWSTSNKR